MILRGLAYLWAAPVTLAALLFAPLAWITGGKCQIVRGAVEIHGGIVTRLLRRGFPMLRPAAAMTLGHVILGLDELCLARSRDHEHVHVRQYERWGPLFLPLYLGASAILYFRGCDPYYDNPFEREAFAATPGKPGEV
jgi:hypothetical protein